MTRILMIDDERAFTTLMVGMLRDEGYQADSASNGAAGLAMAYQDPPDLILCDLQMSGLNGYEVLAALRREPRTAVVPVVFLTGMGGDEAVRHGMNLGADDYLTKPVPVAVLLDTVRARLERSQVTRYEASRRLTELRQDLARSVLPHELLTPLTVVFGLASLLKDGAIEPGQVKEVGAGILEGAQELETKITKFLVYAEMQTSHAGGALEAARTAEVLAQVSHKTATRLGRDADVELAVDSFKSPMSVDHLRAMVQELVENALKSSKGGSMVTIRGRPDADGCLLSVTDRGRGMTREQIAGMERAPFLRRHQEQPGLGMGLTIVRTLAEMYHGVVSFDTAAGKGTTVHVRFGG